MRTVRLEEEFRLLNAVVDNVEMCLLVFSSESNKKQNQLINSIHLVVASRLRRRISSGHVRIISYRRQQLTPSSPRTFASRRGRQCSRRASDCTWYTWSSRTTSSFASRRTTFLGSVCEERETEKKSITNYWRCLGQFQFLTRIWILAGNRRWVTFSGTKFSMRMTFFARAPFNARHNARIGATIYRIGVIVDGERKERRKNHRSWQFRVNRSRFDGQRWPTRQFIQELSSNVINVDVSYSSRNALSILLMIERSGGLFPAVCRLFHGRFDLTVPRDLDGDVRRSNPPNLTRVIRNSYQIRLVFV